jgi:hypothetical protein
MPEITSPLREVIESACAAVAAGIPPAPLDVVDRVLRWETPFIPVTPERTEQDIQFIVDFELTRVQSVLPPQTEYLTVTLYLVGGDAVPLPSDRTQVGNRLAEIDRLNRDEPGVKFRFQPGDAQSGGWIVIESDVRTDGLRPETVVSALERLLECAEARYWDVYQWAVTPG